VLETKQIEHVVNFIIHIGEFDISADTSHIFDISHKHTKPGTGYIVELLKVYNDIDLLRYEVFESFFKLRGCMSVKFTMKI
jgi:hypothetical protein